MNLVRTSTFLAFVLAVLNAALAEGPPIRTRESFNRGWRFARFGPQPDGSRRPEPGSAGWSILASASIEEEGKGNVAEHAIDGDPETRWCASGPGANR